VERFLDDFPTLGHSQESEDVGHADPGACEFPRPVRDFQSNDSNRFEYIDTHDARLDVTWRGHFWSIQSNRNYVPTVS